MKKHIKSVLNKRNSLMAVCFTLLTIFVGCSKDKNGALVGGSWESDTQTYTEVYTDPAIKPPYDTYTLPVGYLKVEINKDGTFTLYRKVVPNSDNPHYASYTGTTFEPSAKGTYKGENFLITDVNNENNGKWELMTDERYGGGRGVYGTHDAFDKLGEAVGIIDFLSPAFTAKIIGGKLVLQRITFSKK